MLPSRLSMARYVTGFVDGFTRHHPFIHMPTFRVTNYTRSPELVLALLAVGAQHRFELARPRPQPLLCREIHHPAQDAGQGAIQHGHRRSGDPRSPLHGARGHPRRGPPPMRMARNQHLKELRDDLRQYVDILYRLRSASDVEAVTIVCRLKSTLNLSAVLSTIRPSDLR